jgi:hypothetical protein
VAARALSLVLEVAMVRGAGELLGPAAQLRAQGARRAAVLARTAVPVPAERPMRVAALDSSSIPAFCTDPETSTA